MDDMDLSSVNIVYQQILIHIYKLFPLIEIYTTIQYPLTIHKLFYTPGGHFIVTAGHCLKSIITRQPGNKPTLCP